MGTILPYVGDIKDIPKKWSLCDGTNGTPDLTGRFLEGVTSNPKKFKDAGLPNIKGYFISKTGGGAIYCDSKYANYAADSLDSGFAVYWTYFDASIGTYNSTGVQIPQFDSPYGKADTVQPKSYTVLYIMKIKK